MRMAEKGLATPPVGLPPKLRKENHDLKNWIVETAGRRGRLGIGISELQTKGHVSKCGLVLCSFVILDAISR